MKRKSNRKTFNESFIDMYEKSGKNLTPLSSGDVDMYGMHVEVDPTYASIIADKQIRTKNLKDILKDQEKAVKEFLKLSDLEEKPKIKSRPELKAMKLSESEFSNKSREVNRRSLRESLSRGWTEDFHYLIDEFMPGRGEGDTMASQAVTAINKLIYKFYNDGDVFDNTHALEGWANDLSTYANWLYKFVPKSAPILSGIKDCYTEEDYQELLQDLASAVLEEKTLDSLADQPKVSSIYSQSGPFNFVDRDEEDDYSESLKENIPLSEASIEDMIDSFENRIDELESNKNESLNEEMPLNEDYSNFIGKPLKDFLKTIDHRTKVNIDFETKALSGHSGMSGLAHDVNWEVADRIIKDIKLGDDRYYKFKILTESNSLNESSVEDMIKAFENRIDELEDGKSESLKESGNTFSIKDQVQRYIVKKLEEEISDITAQEIASKIKGYDPDWCPADVTPLNIELHNRQINYSILTIASALTKILFEDSPEEIKESLREDLDPLKIHDFIDRFISMNELGKMAYQWIFIKQFVSMDKIGEMVYTWMSNDELADMLDYNGYSHEDYLLEARRANKLPPDNDPIISYKIVASDENDNPLYVKNVNGINQLKKHLGILESNIPEKATQIYVTREDDVEIYVKFKNEDGTWEVIEDNLEMEIPFEDRPSLFNKVIADLSAESTPEVKALRELSRDGEGYVGFDEYEMGFTEDNDTFHLSSPNMKQINWAKKVAEHYGFKYSEVTYNEKKEKYFIDIYAPGISNDPKLA